jgi:hypothetical protein
MKARHFFLASILFAFFFLAPSARAHEGMIHKGYVSCLACHTSSIGGGHLTQYGRGIARGSSLRGGEYHQGPIAQGLSLNGTLSHQVQGRLAHLNSEHEKRTFPMQADYLLAVQVSSAAHLRTTLARAPKNSLKKDKDGQLTEARGAELWFVRELMASVDFGQWWRVELGRDRLSLGLRVEDHTMLIQAANRHGVMDFPTQVRVIREGENSRHFFTAFAPAGSELDHNRERGGAVKSEWIVTNEGPHLVVGLNLLHGQTEKIKRSLVGVHTKLAIGHFAFLGQLDLTRRNLRGSDQQFDQEVGLVRLELHALEWLVPYISHEWLSVDEDFTRKAKVRAGGLRFRLSESVSVMADYKQMEGQSRGRKRKDDFFISQLVLNLF